MVVQLSDATQWVPMASYGFMGFLWVVVGSWVPVGFQYVPMVSYVFLRFPMHSYGILWVPMGSIVGTRRVFIGHPRAFLWCQPLSFSL